MIELSLTIEIYIAGVKNRAGFATVNNCFSIFTEVILILFISLSVICTKRRLVAIL